MDLHPPQSTDFDFRGALVAVLRFKWLVLGIALLITAAVSFYTLRKPDVYEAKATIEYDPNPLQPLGRDFEDVASPISNFWSSREFFHTQNRILASRSIAERLVEKLDLHTSKEFWQPGNDGAFEERTVIQTAQYVRSKMEVEPEKETRLVHLKVRHQDPEFAQVIANTWAEVYINKTLEDRMQSTVRAMEWLDDQMSGLQTELNASELALHDFKKQHDVLSVSMEDKQNLVAKDISAFKEKLTEATARRIELQAKVDRLKKIDTDNLAEVEASALEGMVASATRTQLSEELSKREELSQTYGEAHPRMKEVTERIASLEAQLKTAINSTIRAAEADLAEVRKIEAGLQGELTEAHSAGMALNLREIEFERLRRTQENRAKLYELLLQRSTETDLTRMLNTSFVRLLDSAIKPSVPVNAGLIFNIFGGFLAGLILGIGLALLLARMDRRIATIEEVESLGVTSVGVMPLISMAPRKESYSLRRSYARESQRSRESQRVPVDNVHPDTIVHTHPFSAVAESCRAIRTNLTFMSVDDPFKSIVVTSSGPREGKTTVASNIAIAFGQSGRKVLMIDTDLRRPRMHKAMEMENAAEGVTSVIAGSVSLEEAALSTQFEGVELLACGPLPPNPSEMLHHAGFTRLLREARERYDIIILDSPPLGAVTDAAIVGPQVDGVLFVVNAGHTTFDSMKAAIRQLRDVSAQIIGAVLNRVDLESGRYASNYYYYRKDEYRETPEDQPLAAE